MSKVTLNAKNNYYKLDMSNEFPIRNYIVETYGVAPSFVYFDDTFSNEVLDFILKNGELMNHSINGGLKDIKNDIFKNYTNGFFWFKFKDYYVKISVKNENSDDDEFVGYSSRLRDLGINLGSNPDKDKNKPKENKTYNIFIAHPSNLKNIEFSEFEKFIAISENKTKVHLFIKNQYGDYTFEPISVNLPKDLDLELNYGKEFLKVDKTIKDRLYEKPNGLFMFHGPPGTGKTTYIKYLASVIDRDFIYIPTTMIEYFTSDPNCLHTLIQKPNAVIILEDAEKAILKRQGDGMDSSAVSSLLNLSDGILSDILKTSVIVTYNCPKQDVDDALKRKGRLQAEYEFTTLPIEDAKKLAKHLKYPKKFIDEKINESMSISDIYNLEKEVELYADNNKRKPKDANRIIGFGQS
jgi:hypothetical protein